ncbi:hypothetical protein HETIRDRAFT_377513 [Heterobasidion irregulare TC 32-1]|uniref:Carbohydrate kinase PfkB domain-containing protein n=1 Tax=Heterobasidion irregulare (strain TC 32-1) TaxID=747525 RepID=W4KMF7_HETIT|nr:uncharacterized protein HETIRDRAFT_377513 [Heterobasidion irregulare TC 32-1]ETW86879.1 hypothetical protein HETIRDRAFT_377513 [Heterobasidion irregulare TC 32-1]
MLRASVRGFSTFSRLRSAYPASLTRALDRGAFIDIHPEVADALATNKPVVALETTIITHGMPYPVNLETAKSVERNVRSTGAIPATIGVIGGRVKIGLEPVQLEYLADIKTNPSSVKLSRRDLAAAIALKKDGGTTCSTTLIFAALAGIKAYNAFSILGGVHRGGENSLDVSADLQELARCPVGLVSAGVKSILDIGSYNDIQETLGVPVFTYGKTDDFPAFYSTRSGFKSPWRVDSPQIAADVLYAQWKLGMSNGVLFGVPIPETYEAVGERIQQAVEQAVRESEENGVSKRGKEVTPWLLKRVGELTQGKSLASNVALIENTALVGGQIAVAYAKLAADQPQENYLVPPLLVKTSAPSEQAPSPSPTEEKPAAKLLVVGSAAVDITSQASISDQGGGLHSTTPGSVSVSLGGVGRNMAEAAHRILMLQSTSSSSTTILISAVGGDSFGRLLVDEMGRMGMRTDGLVHFESSRSAVCNMVLDSGGNLVGGVADMDIISSLKPEKVLEYIQKHKPSLIAIDANVSSDVLKSIVIYANANGVKSGEPTSVIKSTTILPAIAASLQTSNSALAPITFVSPNLLELSALYNGASNEPHELTSHPKWWAALDGLSLGTEFRLSLEQLSRCSASDEDSSKGTLAFLVDQGIAQMATNLLPFFQHLIIKCGPLGVILAMRIPATGGSLFMLERSNPRRRYIVAHGATEIVVFKHFPALTLPKKAVLNVTGAGDSLVGAILAAIAENQYVFEDPQTVDMAIDRAQRAAIRTLQSPLAVSPALSTLDVEL